MDSVTQRAKRAARTFTVSFLLIPLTASLPLGVMAKPGEMGAQAPAAHSQQAAPVSAQSQPASTAAAQPQPAQQQPLSSEAQTASRTTGSSTAPQQSSAGQPAARIELAGDAGTHAPRITALQLPQSR